MVNFVNKHDPQAVQAYKKACKESKTGSIYFVKNTNDTGWSFAMPVLYTDAGLHRKLTKELNNTTTLLAEFKIIKI